MHSPEKQKIEDSNLPFPTEQLPPEVYNSYDRDEIAALVVEKLQHDGIELSSVVVSGFDAGKVLAQGGFGDRDTTFAVGIDHMLQAENDNTNAQHSPVRYLETGSAYKPAIGVFWLDKLVGSDASDPREYLKPVTPKELANDHKLIYWATKDGESLDTATAKLFLF